MQDPKSGNMIELKDNADPNKVDEALKMGLCILSIGEVVNVKGSDLKVSSFNKKGIMLEFMTEDSKKNFKVNEALNVKQGSFVVESFGKTLMKLRGLPSVRTINQSIIDDLRKQEIEHIKNS